MIDKTTKVVIGIAVILVVVLVGLLVFGSNAEVTRNVTDNGGAKNVIAFGFVGPLTGYISFIGQQNKAAIEVAVEDKITTPFSSAIGATANAEPEQKGPITAMVFSISINFLNALIA